MLGIRKFARAVFALGVRQPRLATLLVGAATFAALWLAPLHRPRATTPSKGKHHCQTILFSKDGRRFAAYFVEYGKGVTESVAVDLYDAATGGLVSTLLDERFANYQDMHANREENLFAARKKDGETTVWSLDTGERVAAALVPDTTRELVVGDGGRLRLFERNPVRLRDAATNEVVAELPVDDKSRIVSHDFDRDQYVVRCTADAFHLYHKSNLQRVASLPAFRKPLDFTLTGRGMCSADGSSCVVAEIRPDTTPGTPSFPIYKLIYHRDTGRWNFADKWKSYHLHLSPDGRLAVRVELVESNWQRISAQILRLFKLQARQDDVHVLHVFDTATRKTVAKMNDAGPAWFSPDSAALVSPGPDSTLQIWNFPVRKPWGTIAAGSLAAMALMAFLLWWRRPSEPERQAKETSATV